MAKSSELLRAILALAGERRLSPDEVVTLMEGALASVAARRLGGEVRCEIDREQERITFWAPAADGGRTALPFRAEDLTRVDLKALMAEIAARLVGVEGSQRVAFWSAYVDRVVPGVVVRGDRGDIAIEIGGSGEHVTTAVLPPEGRIPGEQYRYDRTMDFYVVGFTAGPRKVVLSRSDPRLVLRILEEHVHELATGLIAVRTIARRPGVRTKIMVAAASDDLRIDPAGACIGTGGSRINQLRSRVSDNVDVALWTDDPRQRVLNALAVKDIPADVLVEIGPARERGGLPTARVHVPEALRGKAIGEAGVNVQLASEVSGYAIDIRAPSAVTPDA